MLPVINIRPVVFCVLTSVAVISCEGGQTADNRHELLVAKREASLGGIILTLYDDSTYELGSLRAIKWTGKYRRRNDTLVLTAADTVVTSFHIQPERLEEINNTGIGFLDIEKGQ